MRWRGEKQADKKGHALFRVCIRTIEHIHSLRHSMRFIEIASTALTANNLINAPLGHDGVLATMHNSQLEELVRVNTLAPIVLTKYVVRAMMADSAGRIVNFASIIGFTGFSGLAAMPLPKLRCWALRARSLARSDASALP